MPNQAPAKISWFAYTGPGERIPRTAAMRGSWSYDVECTCGWMTRTGGAMKSYISGEIRLHKMLDH